MRLLLVEDEKYLAGPLCQLLREKNYEVDCVYNGEDGLDYALAGSYDAILLDVLLPGRRGTEVLAELRRAGRHTPVILLTALGEERDIIDGLDLGADDYLPKPFSSSVLLARLRAVTRRQGDIRFAGGALLYADLELTMEELTLRCKGKSIAVARKEAQVMEYLMRNAPMICEKQTIIVNAWGYDAEAADNNVEVYISFLRKKILHIASACRIETVRGLGYRLEAGAGAAQ